MKDRVDRVNEAYQSDPEFRDYVDSYCKSRQISKFEALAHITVAEVAEYYKTKNKDVVGNTATHERSCDAR